MSRVFLFRNPFSLSLGLRSALVFFYYAHFPGTEPACPVRALRLFLAWNCFLQRSFSRLEPGHRHRGVGPGSRAGRGSAKLPSQPIAGSLYRSASGAVEGEGQGRPSALLSLLRPWGKRRGQLGGQTPPGRWNSSPQLSGHQGRAWGLAWGYSFALCRQSFSWSHGHRLPLD